MKQVLIFGGTGFIGQSLAKHLAKNNCIPILVGRNQPKYSLGFKFRQWDAQSVGEWKMLLENAHAVVNLAGKTVDCIKTPGNCDLILKSRVHSTITIGKAFAQIKNYPKIWIQMSTAHIYGDPPIQLHTEDSTTGYGLAPFVATAWEDAFRKMKPADVRGVILRTSFVIGKNGGALTSLQRLVRLGLGGTVGHGRQGMSWIHEDDMNEIIYQAIINPNYKDVIIASAPNPVSNREFMRVLRKQMNALIGIPAPAFITRMGAKYIFKTDPELVLYGRYVKSKRLEELEFHFKFPTLDVALHNLIG